MVPVTYIPLLTCLSNNFSEFRTALKVKRLKLSATGKLNMKMK